MFTATFIYKSEGILNSVGASDKYNNGVFVVHYRPSYADYDETDMYHKRKAALNVNVPPFVQVDSLQAGQTYVSTSGYGNLVL